MALTAIELVRIFGFGYGSVLHCLVLVCSVYSDISGRNSVLQITFSSSNLVRILINAE